MSTRLILTLSLSLSALTGGCQRQPAAEAAAQTARQAGLPAESAEAVPEAKAPTKPVAPPPAGTPPAASPGSSADNNTTGSTSAAGEGSDDTTAAPAVPADTNDGSGGLRYAARPCARCEDHDRDTCVIATHPDGREDELGCGEVSPAGPYAFTIRAGKAADDELAPLVYTYHGPSGVLSIDEESCPEEMSFDCKGPGSFLALEGGAWMQRMGNAGDGSNEQNLENLATRERFELPIGEYSVVARGDGQAVGFLASVPNLSDDDDNPLVGATAGCFDAGTKKLHVMWTKKIAEDDADPYVHGEARWDGNTLVLHDIDGKTLRKLACPPARAAARP